MGPALAAAIKDNDAEGHAAREAVAAFAAKAAELDMLLANDSDDEVSTTQIEVPKNVAPRPDAAELLARRLELLASETSWQLRTVGLEVQRPWSRYLLSGAKTIETRRYSLPVILIGREIVLLETAEATAGISALPDEVPAGDQAVQLVGTLTFGSCFEYTTSESWSADQCRHGVAQDSPYAWTKEQTIFGWAVQATVQYEQPQSTPALRRRMRSLFEVCSDMDMDVDRP